MPQWDHIGKFNQTVLKLQWSHLSCKCRALLRASRRSSMLSKVNKHKRLDSLNSRQTQLANFNSIRFEAFVQQEVKGCILASESKQNISNVFVAVQV